MKEDYYLELLLNKCISLKKSKSVFISYYTYNEKFINKFVDKLQEKGAKDIYLECIDPFYEHELLAKMSCKEIEESGYFDSSIYNTYAKKRASFIFFVSPVPGLYNDIDDEKLSLVGKIKASTKKYFVEKETRYEIPWSIVPLYNKYWEENLGINNLEEVLYDICKVDKNVIDNWCKQVDLTKRVSETLNNLDIDYLEYENELGTKLTIGLPNNYEYEAVGETETLVNIPSYEVFTSPHRDRVNGIVYSSKPLFYNGGIVDEFYLEFKDGKVINYDAKKGKDILESIINYDENSCYLGEAALVEASCPISKTNIIFKTTLLDENASCHLALGRGFGKGTKKSLLKRGINQSGIHVDFMIGTPKTNIIAHTKKGDIIQIMKNGEFVI